MTLSLIGVGSMGGALLQGWIACGIPGDEISVVVRDPSRAGALARELGVRPVPLERAGEADTIVVAVKPHQFEQVLQGLRPAPGSVVVSVAAGVGVAQLEAWLPAGTAVVRVMPNTGAIARQAMSGIVRGTATSEEQLARVCGLFDAVGRTLVLPEAQLDALTAVSGSGIAYVYYVVDAMIEAGVHQGLHRRDSTRLVVQTLLGAATVLDETKTAPATLREGVTSPGGSTAAALRVLDERGVRAAFLAAIEASARRAAELG